MLVNGNTHVVDVLPPFNSPVSSAISITTSPVPVLFVDCHLLIPIPPSAVPLGALFTIIILSTTVTVTLSIVVVIPFTSKLPCTVVVLLGVPI